MLRCPGIGLILLLSGSAAHADSRVEVGAAFGGHAFSSNGELGVDDTSMNAGPASGVALGARAALGLLPLVAVEGEALAIPTRDDAGGDRAFAFGMRAHVRVDLLRGRLRPFVLGGAGMHLLSPSSSAMASDADQSYHWGGGVRWGLSDVLDVRVDARHLIVPDRSIDGATSDFELTAGVSYRFGGSSTRVPHRPTSQLATADAMLATQPDGAAQPDAAQPSATTPGASAQPGATTQPGATAQPSATAKLDRDSDGFPDDKDTCPVDEETFNGLTDDDGCPDQVLGGLAPVMFAANAVVLDAKARASADLAYKKLAELPGLYLEITGHADANEGKSTRALAHKRAANVKAYLVKRGIAAARIFVIGKAAEQPGANAAASRRVELRTLTPDQVAF